jgi:hypothetical protein
LSNFLRALPKWLIPIVMGSALVSSVSIYLFLARSATGTRPRAVWLSRHSPRGCNRINSDFATPFGAPEKDFTVHSGLRDLPGTLYVVTLKRRSANIVIWHGGGDEIFRELNFAFPVFSEHVEDRDVRAVKGTLAGKDHWGYLSKRGALEVCDVSFGETQRDIGPRAQENPAYWTKLSIQHVICPARTVG